MLNIEYKEMPAMRVASVAHTGPYNCISDAFQKLGAIAGRTGLFNGGVVMGIYFDDPKLTPESELRSAAAVTLSENTPAPEGLVEYLVPAGRFAMTTHIGPYSELGSVWAELMAAELPKPGARASHEVSYEIYRNMPGEVPDEKLITELYVPIAAAGTPHSQQADGIP